MTPHAMFEMAHRGIDGSVLDRILGQPEQRWTVRQGRDLLQSRLAFKGKDYPVRVFVDVDREPAEIVTVYRTSDFARYWRTGS